MTPAERLMEIRERLVLFVDPLPKSEAAFLLAELDRAREALTLITEPTELVAPAELVRLRAIARAALGGE